MLARSSARPQQQTFNKPLQRILAYGRCACMLVARFSTVTCVESASHTFLISDMLTILYSKNN